MTGRIAAVVCALMLVSAASTTQAADDSATRASAAASFPRESIEFFESRVRPILADKCFKCHGEKKQSNGLRLDSREAALKGGDSGPSLVAGKPDESLLVQAVAQTHAELKMPPSGKLPDAAVATLREWVAQGAPWPAPSTAAGRDAATERRAGCRPRTGRSSRSSRFRRRRSKARSALQSPVDAFVMARLEAAGLEHVARRLEDERSSAARPSTSGAFHPQPEEVDAFEADTVAGRICAAGRSPARLSPLRRALGKALAGRRPLCRHQGIRLHPGPSLPVCLYVP